VFEGLVSAKINLDRTVRNNRRLVEPEPNAPLLIRIVKYPYRQETHRGRRRKVFEAGVQARSRLEQRELPMRAGRAFKGEPIVGNPIKALDIHPAPLAAPPGVDEWLASVDRRLDSQPGGV